MKENISQKGYEFGTYHTNDSYRACFFKSFAKKYTAQHLFLDISRLYFYEHLFLECYIYCVDQYFLHQLITSKKNTSMHF